MRGGHGTNGLGSLANRTGGPPPVDPPPAGRPLDCPARHCLVEGRPGLLVEWRRCPAGWEGRVLTMIWLDAAGWVTVERWLPATQIDPVPG